jgi:hypothetical protein
MERTLDNVLDVAAWFFFVVAFRTDRIIGWAIGSKRWVGIDDDPRFRSPFSKL